MAYFVLAVGMDRDLLHGKDEYGRFRVLSFGPNNNYATFLNEDEYKDNVRREAQDSVCHEIERIQRENRCSVSVARAIIKYRLQTQEKIFKEAGKMVTAPMIYRELRSRVMMERPAVQRTHPVFPVQASTSVPVPNRGAEHVVFREPTGVIVISSSSEDEDPEENGESMETSSMSG